MNQNDFYAKVPYVNKKVSRIIFGTAMRPLMLMEDSNDLLDAVITSGVNTFDLARNYLFAENTVGNWMESRGCRDNIVLMSKCGHPDQSGRSRITEHEIREDFRISSEALRTGYIDIYLLHRDDLDIEAGQVIEIFNALHAEGKIGAFGGSNWTHERIEAANEYAFKNNLIPFSVSSPNFGLAEQVQDPWGGGCITISGQSNETARDWYRKNQMPLMAYSSLGRGFFSGNFKSSDVSRATEILDAAAIKGYVCEENFERLKRCEQLAKKKNITVPQIALSWIFSQGVNVFASISTSTIKRLQENIDAFSLHLTKEESKYLNLRGI